MNCLADNEFDNQNPPGEAHQSMPDLMRSLNQSEMELQKLRTEFEQKVIGRTRELAQNASRHRALLENLRDMVFLINADGDVTFIDGNVMGILGYTPKEFLDLPPEHKLSLLVSQEDKQRLKAAFRKASRSLANSRLEVALTDKAGEQRWVEITLVPLRDEDNAFIGIQGIVTDINKRIQNQRIMESLNAAARIVQHASLSLDKVFEAVTDQLTALGFLSTVALVDEPNQELVFVNFSGNERVLQALQHLTDFEERPYRIGLDQIEVYSKVVRGRESSYFPLHEEFLTQVLQGCDAGFPSAILRLLPPQRVAIVPLIADDKVLGILSVAGQRLTKSILPAVRAFANQTAIAIKNAQLVDALYESEKQYRGVFEAARDALLLLDQSGIIVEVNPAACAIYGRPYEELVGLPIAEIVHPDHYHNLQNFCAGIALEGHFHAQSLNIRSDGTILPVEVRGSEVTYKGTTHLLAVVTDVSERVQAQEALVRAEKLQALGQMAGDIAHNFNNILVGIRGYTDMALLDLVEDMTMIRSDLEHVLSGANDAAEAVRKLQALYRQADDTSDFAPLQVDDIVSETLALTQPRWKDQAQAQGISIKVHTNLTTPLPILGNASELRRVVTNLVVNAIEAMPDGGTLTIATGQKGDHIFVTVGDTGVGMDERTQEQVFEPFFTTKSNATGLGLTISRSIVERHRGEITVESILDKETVFTIRMPISQVPGHPLGQQVEMVEETGTQPILRVLAVDDEKAACNLMKRFLEYEKYAVVTAHSGQEAIAALEKGRFDLIISDLGMPDISGKQVVHRAYELYPEMPIVVSTGWGETVTPKQLEGMHVLAMLPKPFTRKDMLAILDKVIPDRK